MELLLNLRAQAASILKAHDVHSTILIAALLVSTVILCAFYFALVRKTAWKSTGLEPYLKFAYSCFLKPHQTTLDGGQQSALEGFYSTQVGLTGVQLRSSSYCAGCCVRCHPKETTPRT
jgi:hypothetical protein